MKSIYTWDNVKEIREHPHLLGLLAGKDKLTELHSKWMLWLLDSPEERVLMAHRGSYKTTSISEIGVIWYLMFHPNATIVIIRKSYTDAASIVRNITNMMMMPEINNLLAFAWGQQWKFTTRREGKFELSVKTTKTKELSVEAMGIDSGMTGQHYLFGISDDIVTLKDRISEAEREKTKLVVQELRTNVLNPGCHMIHIGTPWDKRDAFSILPPARKFPLGTTGLLTPEQIALKQTQTTPILFAINYKLEFENEDDLIFSDPHMGKWHGSELTMIRGHLDAAFDGEHTCALTIMGRMKDGRLNAVGFSYGGSVQNWLDVVAQKLVKYGCNKLYIEDNADKNYTALVLSKHPVIKENHIWMSDYHEAQKKEIKISTYLGEVFKDVEWSEESDDEFMEQIIDWRPGMEPDDAPDSAASLVRQGNFSITKSLSSNIWSW